MGLKVVTDGRPVTVFRQDKTSASGNNYSTYCLGVSSKDVNGNWTNGFLNCRFKKGVEIANKSKINIKNSFYTVNEYNGNTYISLFINDFEVVEGGEKKNAADNGFMDIPDGVEAELPFA